MALSLSEAAKGPAPAPRKSKYCPVGLWLETLSDEDREAANAIMDRDSGWTHPAVTQLFSDNGCKGLFRSSVGEHRRNACACEPV